jgi:hypothetical protein
MTKHSVTDFSVLINAYDELKTEILSIRAISSLLLESNLHAMRNVCFYLNHIDKLLSVFEKHMDVFFEKVSCFSCAPVD